MSIFSPPIKNSRDGRQRNYEYDDTNVPTITSTGTGFRRARLCQYQSVVAAKAAIAIPDEVFKKFHYSSVYKVINEAIFSEGIRHIATDQYTFLRLENLPAVDVC
ncbi:hypothetical protein D915_006473 [Fasciola hepatica]|uniref:Uncharacterized protein n=1 Tax=Fasciola hepatica TaxID=6192 RepID=A0A4E0R6G3_FASHE|nr:hypothetical protein D915_006473 [Fasciola hepatica]